MDGGTEDAFHKGEDEHVEEAGGDAGSGPEVGHGGEGEGDPGGGEGEASGSGQGATVNDVSTLHDSAGEPHAHPDEEIVQVGRSPSWRGPLPAGGKRGRGRPEPVAGEKEGSVAEAESAGRRHCS